ncbi:MAG: site-specific integrase [Gemmataceae bacterium]|nr:site-specific integrase [Gemmataceae bacterium]
MAEQLPVRKYVRVWVMRRKNNPRKESMEPTVSYTLQWVVYGRKHVMSLGPGSTLAYAKRMASEKEKEVNSESPSDRLEPVTWGDFKRKYLDTFYPGHDKPTDERKPLQAEWAKSHSSLRSERLAIQNFTRLADPGWCHELTTAHREAFVRDRLAEVPSPASVEADLRVLRALFNIMEEWKHRPGGSNPFAGRGKATVEARRKRAKGRAQEGVAAKEKHYTMEEVRKILALAAKEAEEAADDKTRLERRRLRALVNFVAYTGCRINEAIHLEWKDIDLARGVAKLYFKAESDLKTEDSQAPFGLPPRLIEVLRDWEKDKTCTWVFPNTRMKPWKTGAPGFRSFDQMQELGKRAGVEGANWKRFRHALSTHGKQRFGMSAEQVRAQLRHTTTDTQKHYTHDDLDNLREAVKAVDFERE